jgi:hypothetical protein
MTEKQVAKFNDKMGCLVGWNLFNVAVSHTRAVMVAEKYGLQDDFEFPKLTKTSAYRRAIKHVTSKGEHDLRNIVAVRIRDDEDFVSHALVSPEVVQKSGEFNEVEFDSQIKVGFNKNGITFDEQFITNSPEDPIVKEVEKAIRDKSVAFTADDIRTAFQRAFTKWNALRILPSGGLWWIPEQHSDKVTAWNKFLNEVSVQSTVIIIPTFNNEETVNSIKSAANSSLFSKLESIKTDIENFNEKTRGSTVEKKVEALNDLKKRAAFYEQVLEVQKDRLEEKILEAELLIIKSQKGDTNGTSTGI